MNHNIPQYDFYKHKYGDELLIDVVPLNTIKKYLKEQPVHILTYYDITLITSGEIENRCGTRDTLKIAREPGIHLHFLDNLNDLLGMYTYRHKERHILLNSNMEYLIMQMVCGHEIGHDTFHRDLAKGNEPLPEFVLFDMRTKHEYEANAFASHLIIDDDELIDLMKQDYDVVQLSAAMGTNINLMLIKLNELNRMGWQLNLPYVPHSDFLKNVRPEG